MYLCENQFFNKTSLACLSGAQVGWIHLIKKCQKSCDTATLIKRCLPKIFKDAQEDCFITIVSFGQKLINLNSLYTLKTCQMYMVHAFPSLSRNYFYYLLFLSFWTLPFPPQLCDASPELFFGNKMVQVWNKNTEILAYSRVFYIYFRNAKYKIKFTTWLLT